METKENRKKELPDHLFLSRKRRLWIWFGLGNNSLFLGWMKERKEKGRMDEREDGKKRGWETGLFEQRIEEEDDERGLRRNGWETEAYDDLPLDLMCKSREKSKKYQFFLLYIQTKILEEGTGSILAESVTKWQTRHVAFSISISSPSLSLLYLFFISTEKDLSTDSVFGCRERATDLHVHFAWHTAEPSSPIQSIRYYLSLDNFQSNLLSFLLLFSLSLSFFSFVCLGNCSN